MVHSSLRSQAVFDFALEQVHFGFRTNPVDDTDVFFRSLLSALGSPDQTIDALVANLEVSSPRSLGSRSH